MPKFYITNTTLWCQNCGSKTMVHIALMVCAGKSALHNNGEIQNEEFLKNTAVVTS